MGLSEGSISPVYFDVLGPVPSDGELHKGLTKDQFRPFQDGLEEERAGWCDWRNPLMVPADPNWISAGEHSLFGLRIDSRKIPAATLKAHVNLRLRQMATEQDVAFIGREARISVADEIKAELLRKQFPSTKTVEVAWDRKKGRMIVFGSGSKVISSVHELCAKSFGVELRAEIPLTLGARLLQFPEEDLLSLEPLDFTLEEVEA